METKKTVMIVCKSILPEVTGVLEKLQCSYPMMVMDAALHDRPEELKKKLQETLDQLENVDRVLLTIGYCGGSVKGLKAGDFEMILPRVDDCITMFLGSKEKRKAVKNEERTFFLLKGWLDSERNILAEYQRIVEKYGEDNADMVMEMMYQHYLKFDLVDTGLFEIEPQLEKMEQIAQLLDKEYEVLQGTDSMMERLISGPYDEEHFVLVKPFGEVKEVI